MEDELRQKLGLKVEIKVKGKERGQILLTFETTTILSGCSRRCGSERRCRERPLWRSVVATERTERHGGRSLQPGVHIMRPTSSLAATLALALLCAGRLDLRRIPRREGRLPSASGRPLPRP